MGTQVIPFPHACKDCPTHEHEEWGCGFDGFEGKAELAFGHELDEPYSRTCPRYYAASPFVSSVMRDLRDFKRGALGDVRQLGSAHRVYLEVAEDESAKWESENQHQLSEEHNG